MKTKRQKSKYWNEIVDILDFNFPKSECRERGNAICMACQIELLLRDEDEKPLNKKG